MLTKMIPIFGFIFVVSTLVGADEISCTMEQYQSCNSLLQLGNGESQEELCRIMKDWITCFDEMGSCDDNPSVKEQLERYKEAFKTDILKCGLDNQGFFSECSLDRFNRCTRPLATMADDAGGDPSRMCYSWKDSKICLNELDKDCAGVDRMKEMIATVVQNVSMHMSYCDEIVGCTDQAMAMCTKGLDTAPTNDDICYISEEGRYCIQSLVDFGCKDSQTLQRARDIMESLVTTNKLACNGDGDGQVPGGAQTTHSMFLVLGAMTLVAMMYN